MVVLSHYRLECVEVLHTQVKYDRQCVPCSDAINHVLLVAGITQPDFVSGCDTVIHHLGCLWETTYQIGKVSCLFLA
jgi:hypothetical protein